MDQLIEIRKLEHQLELANRAVSRIGDHATVERLREFAAEISDRLRRLRAATLEAEIKRRSHKLWEDAGRPEGRDLEFWLRAERELSER
ncbi:DUF2934 domain-containing protein [Bradyrhizobium sp. AZCC 2230]|uniref:DUF2934 domain-containing protein n=1 Tax=Bradyrhizobium sp. AZCC 2230 TaxID=3117021 RepID=UPI002FEE8CF3